MKKLLIYLCVTFILAACANEIPEHNQPVLAKRTILAYLSANNNLDHDIMQNVQWMYESLSEAKDTCTLVIYYKPSSRNSYLPEAEILEFQTNGFGEINNQPVLPPNHRTLDNILKQAIHHKATPGNSVNQEVMEDNLKTMQSIAPSKCYGLILGSHANGWIPSTKTSNEITSFSFGDDKGYAINIKELGTVLEKSFENTALDFVLFDACMMGIAEVGYELRHATHHCIASVMETPAVGFPYHMILNALYKDYIDYEEICNTTIRFNHENNLWGAYAAIDCTQMEKLAATIKAELTHHKALLNHLTPHSIQQYGARTTSSSNYTYFSFDIGDVFRQLGKGILPIQQALEKAVIAKGCLEKKYYNVTIDRKRYCGLGMYLPFAMEKTEWDEYYITLGWYKAIGWEELLK